MTMAWEVISEWLGTVNNANSNLTMILVDKPMPLVVVAANRPQHSQQLRQAAAEAAEDSSRSKERVFK